MNLAIGWNQDQPYVVFLVFHNMVLFFFFWILTLFKEEGEHTILELFYNWKHKHMLFVVENAFGNLNKSFKEFLGKFDLDVIFILDLFMCAYN